MDFPIELSQYHFVDSLDEVMSTIYHLFKNSVGEFLSSRQLGSYVEIHSSEVDSLRDSITSTMLEIPNLSVTSVEPQDTELVNWTVVFSYRNETIKYNLDLSSYYGK